MRLETTVAKPPPPEYCGLNHPPICPPVQGPEYLHPHRVQFPEGEVPPCTEVPQGLLRKGKKTYATAIPDAELYPPQDGMGGLELPDQVTDELSVLFSEGSCGPDAELELGPGRIRKRVLILKGPRPVKGVPERPLHYLYRKAYPR